MEIINNFTSYDLGYRRARQILKDKKINNKNIHGNLLSSLKNKNETNRKQTVLVVDDSSSLLLAHCSMLEKLCYHVHTAKDGKEALKLAQDNHYVAIFMDLDMPIMNGIETAKEIRIREKDSNLVPIIIITSDVSPLIKDNCLAAGINVVIKKPVLEADCFQYLINSVLKST